MPTKTTVPNINASVDRLDLGHEPVRGAQPSVPLYPAPFEVEASGGSLYTFCFEAE